MLPMMKADKMEEGKDGRKRANSEIVYEAYGDASYPWYVLELVCEVIVTGIDSWFPVGYNRWIFDIRLLRTLYKTYKISSVFFFTVLTVCTLQKVVAGI